MTRSEAPIYVAKYPNGNIQAVITFNWVGKLDGPMAILYDSGHLSALAGYTTGELGGALRLWEESGRRLLYAEYTKGRKTGLVCLFREDMPWWIQQWDKNNLAAEYLLKWADGVPNVIPKAKLGAEEVKELADASKTLSELETKTEEGEKRFKKELMAWYREEDERIRNQRAAQLGPLKRTAISERANARRAANEAASKAALEMLRR